LQDNGESYSEISAAVIKDAGDDPDITDGMKIVVRMAVPSCMIEAVRTEASREAPRIVIRGGEGIGTVTLPGLGLEPGEPAINSTPRKMIKQNVRLCLERLLIAGSSLPLVVTISIPGGEEMARRTFNPRLGIEGGISVIGTSGIVKPFSSEAFVDSIRKSMEVAKATKSPRIVISSGAKSERYIKARYPDLPPQAFVHYGNFIGETLKIADEEEVACVSLGVMIGKAVKLAEGHLDTHSKKVTMNKAFIQDMARRAGCGSKTLAAIGQMTLARELWDIIPEESLNKFGRILIAHCHRHCAPLLPNGELTILLITENGEIYL
jgi:cobalt-precorrin-5B (C1)-methyltransferase